MMGQALVRLTSSMLWELRSAWASGRRVALTLDPSLAGGTRRLEAHVRHVSPTGAFVELGRLQVPAAAILAVHLPSRLGDSTIRSGSFHGDGHAPLIPAGQLRLGEL